jgi:23S rRNA pseudouridine1911/1915/1917 synthase
MTTDHGNCVAPAVPIVYQDQHLICVCKPARTPVASEDSGDVTLLDQVRQWNAARQDPGKKGYCVPIHFLDRPVSGVILFALSSKGASRLNEQFRNHKIRKTYLALVQGVPLPTQQKLIHWLAKDGDQNRSYPVVEGDSEGKKCILSFQVRAQSPTHSLLEVNPVTGRSHQIRAQLSAIGHPIFGDKKYGSAVGWDGRIALHARKIMFQHPVSKEELVLEAPCPSYWRTLEGAAQMPMDLCQV